MKIQELVATLSRGTRPTAFAGLLTLMAGFALAGQPPPDPDCVDLRKDCVVYDEVDGDRYTLAALCKATADTNVTNALLKDMDRTRLMSKVLAAGEKLYQGKTGDADQKLGDYEAKLDQLEEAAKPKISMGDYSTLSGYLGDARACVIALPPETPKL